MAETSFTVNNMSGEMDSGLPMEYKNMSNLVADAMKLFIEEKKKSEIIEKLKNGYKEMSELNLRLSEMGLEQDNLELARYELSLKRCDLL